MTEKVKSEKMSKPVPMKLFAAWEVDRTPSNCVPRLCTLTVTRLTLCGPLPAGLSSVSLAARMLSSKRTLRSNEIPLPAAGAPPLDTDLELNFSLQYPHFVKRDGDRLQILLQRRKKYKNRTILGYKTLAEGFIRMDQVLQRSMDMELELCDGGNSGGGKNDKGGAGGGGGAAVPIARLALHQLSSTPVDHDTKNNNTLLIADRGYSDEEEEAEFSSVEDNDEGMLTSYSSNRPHGAIAYNKRDHSYTKLDRYSNIDRDSYIGTKAAERDSDSEFENRHTKRKGGSRGKMAQRNLKQKFAALLRRFRMPEELESGGTRNSNNLAGDREIDELFQELDSLSCCDDSGPEMDTISISSTPKPSLRPFFASSRSLAHHDNLHNPTESDQWRNRGMERGGGGPDGSLLPFLDQDDPTEQLLSREQPANDHQLVSGSPPREKDEKRSRLFRTNVGPGSGSKKKQQNSLTIATDHSLRPLHSDHSAQSPTIHEPRRILLDQVSLTLNEHDVRMPDSVCLVLPARENAAAAHLAQRLSPLLPQPALNPHNPLEVKAVMQALLNKICKQCHTSAKPMQSVRVVLLGPDALVSGALRAYVDLWAQRPPDWGAHVRFYIVPLGVNYISRYLSSVDPGYGMLFGGESWLALCERAADGSLTDTSEFKSRINRYVNGSGPTVQLPIAEAMVAYREKMCDEDPSQIFVPFVNDVRIGSSESAQHSVDLEEALSGGGGSPPALSSLRPSPPATPAPPPPHSLSISLSSNTSFSNNANSNSLLLDPASAITAAPAQHWEPLELNLDYWQIVKPGESQGKPDELSARRRLEGHLKSAAAAAATAAGGGSSGGSASDKREAAHNSGNSSSNSSAQQLGGRSSLKCTFRLLQAARLTPGVDPQVAPSFHITYATKEKKQKIMRLGKKKEKDKDTETGKNQTLENISRLICSAKTSHNVPLRVYIDGAEWNSVKFFQLSLQWQSHVKNFPIALLGAPLAPQELS